MPFNPNHYTKSGKKCHKCGNTYPATLDHFFKSGPLMLHSSCKLCSRNTDKEYYKTKGGKQIKLDSIKRSTYKLKQEVLEAYCKGKPKCKCCGEENIKFLTIDHVENDGAAHRRKNKLNGGTTFYRWLRTNRYPTGFQVLCYNCNCAKGVYGKCPHKDKT